MASLSRTNRPFHGEDLLSAAAGLCAGFALAGIFFDLFALAALAKAGLLLAFGLPLAITAAAAGRCFLWPAVRGMDRRRLTWSAAGALVLAALLTLLGGFALDAPPSPLNLALAGLLTLSKGLALAALLFTAAVRFPLLALVFAWPFAFLFPYVFSVAGRFTALGNDFTPFYYVYKVYLLDCLSRGRLPLWSPSESAGYPFYASPLAETFYPLNLPLTWLYRLSGGYTLQDHQIFTVFGIAVFSVGLYLWLRRLGLPQRAVLAGTLVLAISFKVTEIIRFPNAIHTAAWHPWILLALTGVLLAKSWKARLGYAALLAFSGVCLVTGGYPYFTYYIVFLAGPYLAVFLIPALRRQTFGEQAVDWKRGLPALAGGVAAAGAACLPWLVHVTALMQETSKRAGGSLAHALSYGFSWQDTLASIFFPPAAMPEGWFYFGALAGLLTTLFLLVQPFRSGPGGSRLGALRIFFALWIVLISLSSYGEQTALFRFFYDKLPFFNQLRAWSRLNIILVPIFAWLVALGWRAFETWLKGADPESRVRAGRLALAAGGLTLLVQAVYLAAGSAHLYWDIFFVPRASYLITSALAPLGVDLVLPDASVSLAFRLGFVFFSLLAGLLAWLAVARRANVAEGRFPAYATALLAAFVLFSAANLGFAGPWLWTNGVVPVEERKELDVERQNLMSFSNPRKDEYTTLTLSQSFNAGYDERWHFDRYKDFRASIGDEAAEAKLLGKTDGQKLYFTSSDSPASVAGFLDEAAAFSGAVTVLEYNGDWLVLQIETPSDGYLHFIDNWAEGWQARLDGRPVEISRLFGVFKSAPVPAGEHTLEMMYCPGVFSVFNPACK